MQHPDLTVVEAEHEGEVLRIDQVRELQHSLSLAPYEARYRVALILRFEEAHSQRCQCHAENTGRTTTSSGGDLNCEECGESSTDDRITL